LNLRPFLSASGALAVALTATLAVADEPAASRAPEEPSAASAPDPGASRALPSAPPATGVPPVPDRERPPKSLGIDLKIDGNGFRLGGRLAGSKGVSEASIGGQVRADGVTLDGRVKGEDGQPRDFKLNLDLLPGWTSTAFRLWRLLP
jgi:hypothetical protein